MRRLCIALGLLALLLAASLANAVWSKNLTDTLTARLEQAGALAARDQWTQAESVTREAYQCWQDHHFYLHSVMRHGDTDEILRAFRSVLQYVQLREMDQYAAANAELITLIGLLAEMEQISLVNIL